MHRLVSWASMVCTLYIQSLLFSDQHRTILCPVCVPLLWKLFSFSLFFTIETKLRGQVFRLRRTNNVPRYASSHMRDLETKLTISLKLHIQLHLLWLKWKKIDMNSAYYGHYIKHESIFCLFKLTSGTKIKWKALRNWTRNFHCIM